MKNSSIIGIVKIYKVRGWKNGRINEGYAQNPQMYRS